jgi:hypothetical protein
MWVARPEPRFLDAYPIETMIDVMDRQVEVTIDFGGIPHPILNQPKKFISRDPAVIDFMARIHAGIVKRYEAADFALGTEPESEEVA